MIIGEFTYGSENIQIFEWGEGSELIIGKYCSIAPNLKIFLGGNHNFKRTTTYPFGHINQEIFGDNKFVGHPKSNGDVVIENDVWIGHGVTIMSGVTISNGAVIAANSHVVNNVDAYTIVGGNPAGFIKSRFDQKIVQRLLELKWWNWPVEKVSFATRLLCLELDFDILDKLEKLE